MAEGIKSIPNLPANMIDYITILDEVAFRLSKKIALATQMETIGFFASESYQVANYGIGGQYGAHYDPSGYVPEKGKLPNPKLDGNVMLETCGDRIATFMGYLSNVEAGGKTVFPILGLGTDPVEGKYDMIRELFKMKNLFFSKHN